MRTLCFILLSFVALIFSCKGPEEEISYVLLSGTIKNTNETVIKMGNYDYSFKKEIAIDKSGKFKDTVYIDKSGFYFFQVGKSYTSIFLKKGDNLNFVTDANDFYKSLYATGKGAVLNNYYVERIKLKAKLVGNAKDFFVVPIEDFLAKIKKNKKLFLAQLENAKLNDKDYKIQKKMIEHDYLLTRYNYDKFNHYHTKEHPKLPLGYYDPIINLNLDDEESFHYDKSYRYLVIENWRLTSKEAERNNPNYSSISFVKNMIKDIKSTKIKDQIVSMLFRQVSPKNKNFEQSYNEILPLLTSEIKKEKLKKRYLSAQSTQPEMKVMDFVYENHKGGKTSLNELKGKILYVEIWATWCGPCIKEMPSLTDLIKTYKGKPIEFISISIDSKNDYKKWRAMVPEKNVGGVQLLADKGLKSDFMKFFSVGLIPRSILIDQNGNIITAKAPRPSAKNTKQFLDSLLNKNKLKSKKISYFKK